MVCSWAGGVEGGIGDYVGFDDNSEGWDDEWWVWGLCICVV